MAGRERTIKVTVVGDESSLARAFKRAGRQSGVFKSKLKGLAGVAGIGGLVIGLKKAGEAVVGMAGSFEESLAKIVGLVGINKEQVDEWGDAILALAPKVGKSANELADALFFITSAGIRGSESMEVLEASAKAASAGLGETKDVAFAAVSAMNAYGIENLSAAQATDILVNTVREGNLEASELAGAIGQIIPIASEFGVSFDQVGASVAAMTRLGASATESITNLQGIFKALIKPTTQSNLAFEEMGTSAAALRRTMREDGLLATLEILKDKLAGNEEAFTKVFGRVQGLTGFLSLMGKNAETNAQIFENLANSTGKTDEAFAAASDTANFQFRAALAELQSVGIELGSEILPELVNVIQEITPQLVELIPQFASLAIAILKVVTALAQLTAPLIGPLATGLDGTGNLIQALTLQLRAFAAGSGLGGASLARFDQIMFSFNRQALTTGDRLEDAKRILRIMATEGNITGDVLDALAHTFGLTSDELADIARESRGWSSDVEGLNRVLEEHGIAVTDAEVASEALADANLRAQRIAGRFKGATEDTTEAIEDQEDAIDDDVEELKDLNEQLRDAIDAQESLMDVIRQSVDPVFNLVKEVNDYGELLEEVAEKGGITTEEQFKLAEAGFEVAAAFEAMDDPEQVLEAMDLIGEAMDIPRQGVIDMLAEFGIFVDEAGNISHDIAGGLLDGFIGLGVRMGDVAAREIQTAVGIMKGTIQSGSPSRLFAEEIGEPMAEGIAQGILDGMDEARSALETLTDTLIDDATSDLDAFMSAIRGVTGRRTARERARDAEADQEALQLEKELLPARLAAAQAALIAAEAEDALADSTLALAEAELAAAEAALEGANPDDREAFAAAEDRVSDAKKVLKDAVRREKDATDDLADATEELAEARERQADIDQDLLDAADDILLANLALVQAQKQLIEVGSELLDGTKEGEQAFVRLASSAGLSTEEIGNLIRAMREALALAESFEAIAIGGGGTVVNPLLPGSSVVNALLATSAGSPERIRLVDELFRAGVLTQPDYWKNVVAPSAQNLSFLQANAAAAGLAQGGIATQTTFAKIGEGGTDEAVIPLNEEGIDFLAEALRAAGGVGGNSIVVQVQSNADPQDIAFELAWLMRSGIR